MLNEELSSPEVDSIMQPLVNSLGYSLSMQLLLAQAHWSHFHAEALPIRRRSSCGSPCRPHLLELALNGLIQVGFALMIVEIN
jgi:hypothetical protein